MGMIEAIGLVLAIIGGRLPLRHLDEDLLHCSRNTRQSENDFKNRPLKIRRAFLVSIIFNEAENLPQVFFDFDSDIGQRLASKSSIARPYQNIDGEAALIVPVLTTDEQKFLHGVDALNANARRYM